MKAKGFALAIISGIIFGFTPFFILTAEQCGSNTLNSAFFRYFISLPIAFALVKAKGLSFKITKTEFWQIMLLAMSGQIITGIILFVSYDYISSGAATTLHFTYPVWVIIGNMIFIKLKPTPTKILCVALCTVGMFMLHGGVGTDNPFGIFLAVLSGATYSIYVIFLENSEIKKMDNTKILFYMCLFAVISMFLVTVFTDTLTFNIEPKGWLSLTAFAIGATFFGVLLFQISLRYISGQDATIMSAFEPITSLVVGAIFLKEVLSLSGVIGCALILSAVVIIAKTKEEKKNLGQIDG